MPSLKEKIRGYANYEWGGTKLSRIRKKPDNMRYKCPGCGQERALLLNRIDYTTDNTENYVDVYMAGFPCGVIYYYVEFPDDEIVRKREHDNLIKSCNDALRSLQ